MPVPCLEPNYLLDIAIDHPDLLYTFLYLTYLLSNSVLMFFCQVTLVRKAHTSPRNSTWLIRLFFLVKGWGLGTRLYQNF